MDSFEDSVTVCLPKADVKGMRWPSDTTWLDTVFINHDSMKVAGDVPVFLVFKDDATSKEINLKEKIDSVGYRYRSFWIANENYNDSLFRRIYRHDSSYVRWANAFPTNPNTCLVKLNHDSLYAIGGNLTIDARGALAYVDNINNAFKVNSDSITSQGDTIRHKILIDADPFNAEFDTYLATDRIRAIAWKEHAGYGNYRCHGQYRPQWNHYWGDFVVGRNVCPGTLVPCESNSRGSTATGIMQILRTQFENQFLGIDDRLPIDSLNDRPFYVSWDSLAWNWKVCIYNGRYIHDVYMPTKFEPKQDSFPDSCSFVDCDTFPKSKNKEDLKAYGYHRGENRMKEVIDDVTWKLYIANDSDPQEFSVYVQNVRKYYYRKPW